MRDNLIFVKKTTWKVYLKKKMMCCIWAATGCLFKGGGAKFSEEPQWKKYWEKKTQQTLFWFCSDFHLGSGEPALHSAWFLAPPPFPSSPPPFFWCWVTSKLCCSWAELRSTPDPGVSCWGSFIPSVKWSVKLDASSRTSGPKPGRAEQKPRSELFFTWKKKKRNETLFCISGINKGEFKKMVVDFVFVTRGCAASLRPLAAGSQKWEGQCNNTVIVPGKGEQAVMTHNEPTKRSESKISCSSSTLEVPFGFLSFSLF